MEPQEVNYVIYHHPCPDGLAGALAADLYFNSNKNIIYYPTNHGTMPPNDITGKNVLIVDFSYKKDIINKILKQVNKLLIIDHHKSAMEDLKDIDDSNKIFNMNYSGAMLAWKYFFNDKEPPMLYKYIQDRDIWTNKMPLINEFVAYFNTIKLEFDEYKKFLDDEIFIKLISEKGTIYNELNKSMINNISEQFHVKFMKIKEQFCFVAYINSNVFKSELGSIAFSKFDLIDFSAVYNVKDWSSTTTFSLRSTNDHMDVSKISFSLGGGGHRNASGIELSYVSNILPGIYFNDDNLYKLISNIYFDTIKIDDNEYNIVYLCSQSYKKELGRYLLQDKNNGIQECAYINNKKNIQQYNNKRIDVAAIWHYQYPEDETQYKIVFETSGKYKLMEELFKKKYNMDDNYVIKYNGIVKKI